MAVTCLLSFRRLASLQEGVVFRLFRCLPGTGEGIRLFGGLASMASDSMALGPPRLQPLGDGAMESAAVVFGEADAPLLLRSSWMPQVPANPELPEVQLRQVRYRAARLYQLSKTLNVRTLHVIPVTGNFIHGRDFEVSVRLATNTRW